MLQSQIKAAVLMHQQQGLSQYDFAQVEEIVHGTL